MRYCFFGSAGEVAVSATYVIEQGGTRRQAVDAGPILGCGVPDDQCLTKQHVLPPSPGQEPGDAATAARPVSAS
jgi:hypothetical protein